MTKNAAPRNLTAAAFFSLALLPLACTGTNVADGAKSPDAPGHAAKDVPGLHVEWQDPNVSPGDDFYRFANGSWLDSYKLEPDEMLYGAFVEVVYKTEDQVQALLAELSERKPAAGSIEQKISDYFQSFMEVEQLNLLGITPLKAELDAICALRNHADLVAAFGKSGLTGTNTPIDIQVSIDRDNPERHVVEVAHSGLGLPDRDYYLEAQFEPVRAAYKDNIETLLTMMGGDEALTRKAAEAILDLETKLARHFLPNEELRRADVTRNKMSLGKLEKKYPSYPFRAHLKAAGVDPKAVSELNVATPGALEPIGKLVRATPLHVWQDYLAYHLIKNHAPLLSDDYYQAYFDFYGKVLRGQQEPRERSKRAIQLIGSQDQLGPALGKLYVERHFPESAKQQVTELVGNLKIALQKRIEGLDWMGAKTKSRALEKLQTFRTKVGYPNKWRDFSQVEISPDSLMKNYQSLRKYWYEDAWSRLGKKTDREEWLLPPHEVNAYYNPQFNEIVFPAAILQPPFFDPEADAAINYGAIGAVIGHEIGHGFDDQGSQFDARGRQKNWWSKEDRKRFEELTEQLVLQYDGYEPLEGQKLNGKLTLGENIGDIGGLSMAYHAYQLSLAGRQAPEIGGLSGGQRFFLSWAQLWAAKYREEFLLQLLKTDPHSPAEFRVNGVVRNLDAWYEAFDVKSGDRLFLDPQKRVTIW